jgi:hypothetical protein
MVSTFALVSMLADTSMPAAGMFLVHVCYFGASHWRM